MCDLCLSGLCLCLGQHLRIGIDPDDLLEPRSKQQGRGKAGPAPDIQEPATTVEP